MSIFRSDKSKGGYTQISNEILQSKTLSFEAKGVLVELLSRPKDWKVILKTLERPGFGRDRVRRVIRELGKQGHLHCSAAQGEKGRLRGHSYVVYEDPRMNPYFFAELPIDGSTGSRNDRPTEKPHLQRKINKNTELKKESPIPPSGEGGFDSLCSDTPDEVAIAEGNTADGPEGSASRFPRSRDASFPKCGNGSPDWATAVLRFDEMHAILLAAAFPLDPEFWNNQATARAYYSRRSRGVLTDWDIRRISKVYRDAHSDEIPANEWRFKNVQKFLTTRGALRKAKALLMPAIRDALDEIKADELQYHDVGPSLKQLASARLSNAKLVFLPEEFNPCARLVAGHERGVRLSPRELIEMQQVIRRELTQFSFWRLHCSKNNYDVRQIFGYSMQEIAEFQMEYLRKLRVDRDELEALLELPTPVSSQTAHRES